MSESASSVRLVNDSCHAFVLSVHANDLSDAFVIMLDSANTNPQRSFEMNDVITRVSTGGCGRSGSKIGWKSTVSVGAGGDSGCGR